jgi:putative ABC transport system permease protein
MLKNQILIAIRNLSRHKGYSFINIAGLTIGIASCLLILLFVTSELSYDRYHEKSNRIYRIGIEAVFGDSHFFSAYTSGAMKDALDYEIGEVEESMQAISYYKAGNQGR